MGHDNMSHIGMEKEPNPKTLLLSLFTIFNIDLSRYGILHLILW